MSIRRSSSLLAVVLLVVTSVAAAAEVAVSDAWVRGTVAGQKATGAFMRLTATTDVTLVDAASTAAKIVEVHQMKQEGGVMKMSAVSRLPLPAGKAVLLQPGGYHVMLMDLTQPLKDGDMVPITLTFEDKNGAKQTVAVKAVVRPLGK